MYMEVHGCICDRLSNFSAHMDRAVGTTGAGGGLNRLSRFRHIARFYHINKRKGGGGRLLIMPIPIQLAIWILRSSYVPHVQCISKQAESRKGWNMYIVCKKQRLKNQPHSIYHSSIVLRYTNSYLSNSSAKDSFGIIIVFICTVKSRYLF